MTSRIDLHEELVRILGSNNVYFQPPESIKLKYPCIVYTKTSMPKVNADDGMYKINTGYKVVYVHKDPDEDDLVKELLQIPHSRYSTCFTSDNLYHDVLEIYI